MTDQTATSVSPVHASVFSGLGAKLEALFADFKNALAFVTAAEPAAVAAADTVEVLTGNGELVPVTNLAGAAEQATNAAVQAGSVEAGLASVTAAVNAVHATIAAVKAPAIQGGPGPVKTG